MEKNDDDGAAEIVRSLSGKLDSFPELARVVAAEMEEGGRLFDAEWDSSSRMTRVAEVQADLGLTSAEFTTLLSALRAAQRMSVNQE